MHAVILPLCIRPLRFYFPNAGRDFVNPFDFAVREREPLDASDTIRLPGGLNRSALSQQNGNGVALSDHVLNLRLLALQSREIPLGCGHHVVAAAPGSIQRAKAVYMKFDIVGQMFAECAEITLDDGAINPMKNGLRIAEVGWGCRSYR
jgi:hypothetical protein